MSTNPVDIKDINELNEQLVTAAGQGKLELVQKLVNENAADLRYQSKNSIPDFGGERGTALNQAVFYGKAEVVQWILKQHAGVASCEILDSLKESVLHRAVACDFAIRGKNGRIITLLLKACPELRLKVNADGMSPLLRAARMGDFNSLKLILNLFPDEIQQKDYSSRYAVHHIVEGESVFAGKDDRDSSACLRFILDRFPECFDSLNYFKKTFVQIAVQPPIYEEMKKIILLALNMGAYYSNICLQRNRDNPYIDLLLKFESLFSFIFDDLLNKKTPLNVQKKSKIDECGLKINVRDGNGNTILHLAILQQDEILTLYVLLKGARVDLNNISGLTALECAHWTKNPNLIAMVSFFRGKQLLCRLEEECLEYQGDTGQETKTSEETKKMSEMQAFQEVIDWHNQNLSERVLKILNELSSLYPQIEKFAQYLEKAPKEYSEDLQIHFNKMLEQMRQFLQRQGSEIMLKLPPACLEDLRERYNRIQAKMLAASQLPQSALVLSSLPPTEKDVAAQSDFRKATKKHAKQ